MTRTGNTVAVIGLRVMGAPMAANLIDAGYDVAGFNRSRGRSRPTLHEEAAGHPRSPRPSRGPTSC